MRLCQTAWIMLLAVTLGSPLSAGAQDEATAGTTADGRDKRSLKLPGTVDDVVVGGSGQFLVAHLKSLNKLAIIDVKNAKVAKYISLPSEDVLFAAGAQKIYVVLKGQGIIQRLSLATFEREVAVPLPTGAKAGTLTMGHAAAGPILLGAAGEHGPLVLLDAKTLQPIESKLTQNQGQFECYEGCVVRAAPQGQVFTSWRTNVSPNGFYTLLMQGHKGEAFYDHESLGLLSPNEDGSRIYTNNGVYNNKTGRVSPDGRNREGVMLPSVTGDYYLRFAEGRHSLGMANSKAKRDVTIHLAGDSRPLVTLSKLLAASGERFDYRSRLHADKRVFFFPDLSSLALLNEAENGFDFVTINLDDELDKSGIDYLFVKSRPPLTADPGTTFTYQVAVKSKKQGVKISLASGPDEMKVDDKGKLTWPVPAGERGELDVILAVSDSSGQEVFQTFRLSVGDGSPGAAARPSPPVAVKEPPSPKPTAPKPTAGSPKPAANNTPPTTAPAAAPVASKPLKITPAKLDAEKTILKLPAAAEKMEVGGGGRYLVLHLKSLRKLAIVDLCEAKVAGYIAADDDNLHFAAGAEKLIVVLGEKKIITRWDLATRTREVTVPSEDPIRGVLMGNASAGPLLLFTGQEGDQFRGIGGGGMKFLDLIKLRPIEVAPDRQGFHFDAHPMYARVSGDGRTFCIPGSFGSAVYLYDGQRITIQRSDNRENYGPLIPGPDGQVLYGGGGRYSQQLRLLGKPNQTTLQALVPSIHGRFYLSVQFDHRGFDGSREEAPKLKVAIHIEGDSRPLVTLDDFQLTAHSDGLAVGSSAIALDKRIAFVPDAKVIATMTPTNDGLELRQFDLDAALEASGIDYLFVTSRPPSTVKPNETLSYQLEVKSKKGGVKHRLESGPEGMSLSEKGLLTWKVPAPGAADAVHAVIVAVSDAAEQEVFHTFQLSVEGASKPAPTTRVRPPSGGLVGSPLSPGVGETPQIVRGIEGIPTTPPAVRPDGPSPATPQPYAKVLGQSRKWTDAESGRTLEATFLGVEVGKLKARNKEGKDLLIPLERLSREDLIWLLEGK